MSNYAAAALVNGQSLVEGRYNYAEQRRPMPTILEMALKNTEYAVPDPVALRTSPLRTVDISYFTDVAAGSGTTKAYNHTGTYGDSGKINIVYYSMVEKFSLPRKIAANNFIQYAQMYANLYEQVWKNLRTRHNTQAQSFLFSNRVQLAAGTMNPLFASAGQVNWNDTNYAFEVSQTDKALFIQRAKAVMEARFFTGEYDVVADLNIAQNIEFAISQGASNATNLNYQFQGCNIAKTQSVIDSNYSNGALYMMPKGSLVGLNWNEQLNVMGVNQDEGGSIGILTTAVDPLGSGAVADVSVYTTRTDTSANTTGGSTQELVDQFEYTLTVGYAFPPMKTNGESVNHEFGQN